VFKLHSSGYNRFLVFGALLVVYVGYFEYISHSNGIFQRGKAGGTAIRSYCYKVFSSDFLFSRLDGVVLRIVTRVNCSIGDIKEVGGFKNGVF